MEISAAVPHLNCWDSADHSERRDILGHHGAGSDDRPFSDADSRKNK
jgi:hypothetical protein